jgi:hypothetical protein
VTNKHIRNGSIHLEKKFKLFGGFYYICTIYNNDDNLWCRGRGNHKNKFTAYRKALKEVDQDREYKQHRKDQEIIRQMNLDGSVMTINGEDYKLTKMD